MPARKRPHAAKVTPPAHSRRLLPITASVALLIVLLLLANGSRWHLGDDPSAASRGVAENTKVGAHYVGVTECGGCHAAELAEWQQSDHAHSMLEASDAAVRGDFSGVTLPYDGGEARFFRRDGKPFVHTEGADGKPADFEIRHTFGWYPLQQYLVDIGTGRLQALPFAWDARGEDEGGQRWFHLYADQPPRPGDSLHWTGRDQNWNFMCAGCHSTNLEKRYEPQADRFDTRWSDINVACEACHGPGSKHVEWAKTARQDTTAHKGLTVPMVPDGKWAFTTAGKGIAHWNGPDRRAAMQPCFACHSRRREIANPLHADTALFDQAVPSLLEPGLYHVDGQIDGEVFEYGSFLQSRMYRAGVICQDCHQPHTGKLRLQGNALCTQCHAPASFATPGHHHHAAGSAGSQCVDCHMTGKTYMGVDFRRDHSFRLPRPELSEAFGTPNACTGCHADQPASWATAQIRDWIGESGRGHAALAAALDASRRHRLDAAAALLAVLGHAGASPIARATAVAALADYPGPQARERLRLAASDPEPLLRLAAVQASRLLAPDEQQRLLLGRLNDATLAVRTEAARLAIHIPDQRLDDAARTRLDAVVAELVASETIHLDRPEARLNLALIDLARGNFATAEAALQQALHMDQAFVPARINLADLYRASGRDAEVEALLREGLRISPDSADLKHALGLFKVRQGDRRAALELLAAAAKAAPDNPRYAYVYAVALLDSGDAPQALAVTRQALARTPNDASLAGLLRQIDGQAPP